MREFLGAWLYRGVFKRRFDGRWLAVKTTICASVQPQGEDTGYYRKCDKAKTLHEVGKLSGAKQFKSGTGPSFPDNTGSISDSNNPPRCRRPIVYTMDNATLRTYDDHAPLLATEREFEVLALVDGALYPSHHT